MPGAFVNKRIRKNQKAITFAAGAQDYIPMSGPFSEIIWNIAGTTDAHTIDGYGIERCIRRCQIQSNKRGMLADMDGITMYRLSVVLFNVGTKVDTVGGAAVDGIGGILPLGCDADELITMSIEWGALVDMCSTNDLLGYTGVLRTSVTVLNEGAPSTYFAYRNQYLGASGVIGVAGVSIQPQVPTIPGFFLTGLLCTTETTSLTTAPAMALTEAKVTQADDYLVDDFVANLQLFQSKRVYNAQTVNLLLRHIPVIASDITLVQFTNGGTATIFPSKVCYIYLAGKISGGEDQQKVHAPTPLVPTPQAHSPTMPQATRPSLSQPGFSSLVRRGH
jgi:hypothetical protein